MRLIEITAANLNITFPLGHLFAKEAGRAAFRDDVFSQLWANLLECGLGKIYALVDGVGLELVVAGVLGATFIPDPFSGLMTGAEHFWFVVEEHRKSGVGLQLLDKFEEDAKSKGCKQLVMVHFCHMGQGLAKLYEARGYKALEQTFKKDL